MDDDLNEMDNAALRAEVMRLRNAIREHRDASKHDLCWFQPDLWGLLSEGYDPQIEVPEWPQFMRGCIHYRSSLNKQVPKAPRVDVEFGEGEQ